MLLMLNFLLLIFAQGDSALLCDSCQSITISYSATIQSKKRNKAISELYNGATKVLYLLKDSVRIRQVSLLRTETVIFSRSNEGYSGKVLQESSGTRRNYNISEPEWKASFSPFENVRCQIDSSSQTILGYLCKKATVSGREGEAIIAYFTTVLQHSSYAIAEPMFACLPGVVLKYEFRTKESVITYTASRIRVK